MKPEIKTEINELSLSTSAKEEIVIVGILASFLSASWSQFWPPAPANASSPTHPETRAQLGAKHGAILIAQL